MYLISITNLWFTERHRTKASKASKASFRMGHKIKIQNHYFRDTAPKVIIAFWEIKALIGFF